MRRSKGQVTVKPPGPCVSTKFSSRRQSTIGFGAMANAEDTHGVLFILDEFPTLGKMDIFTDSIPYFRGYKVRLLMIAQNLNDVKASYCEKGTNSLLSNSNRSKNRSSQSKELKFATNLSTNLPTSSARSLLMSSVLSFFERCLQQADLHISEDSECLCDP